LLELFDQPGGLFQLPLQGLLATERTRSSRRTHAQPILSDFVQIDNSGRRQRRHMLD